ncbi:hypothetical protein [Roseovarius sp. SYSU LYC5161]|uniref:hypothetical protein n=1 Tax=Roseovarius halophilus (ex Wu et al. 2025) TaxID=3376060 RepID=UPI003999CB6D
MSTEHQQYSTRNQAKIIEDYAEQRGIEVIKTRAVRPSHQHHHHGRGDGAAGARRDR